ncbi:MAG: hypothetical protein CMH56_13070 [Myxococcales bacterium]|nr:hypothetical protein [Myxococcales bacterium]|tara:strand:- start:436 stop:795 length:360 start_codon:yes stop_codon:yes gene_type:complete
MELGLTMFFNLFVAFVFVSFFLLVTGRFSWITKIFTPSKPQSLPLGLLLVCSLIFGLCLTSTFASAEDAYGYKGNYDKRSYKGGDLYIVGYGMYGYPYGGRMGSRGNRGYMGGGLRGGK